MCPSCAPGSIVDGLAGSMAGSVISVVPDHDTLEPVEYYCKLPEDVSEQDVVILTCAGTGGSEQTLSVYKSAM